EVLKIGDELRKQRWSAMGGMHDEMAKLRDAAWAGGKRDRAAILAAHKRMSELRQQQLELSLDAAEKIDKVLKPEQRERLGRTGPWWMMGAGE
ncbi:MAG TPA: Spy/CpxP family protein refolding chaperone, partial [Burkholderiaceae bacterium]|nr:Spy/CpxP family protein refolding chaperone [Burkholderiaceae bacterium]